MVVKEMVSGNVYSIEVMNTITGSSLGKMPPTDSLVDVPLAEEQEQHNKEYEVTDQGKSTNWWDALGLLNKNNDRHVDR